MYVVCCCANASHPVAAHVPAGCRPRWAWASVPAAPTCCASCLTWTSCTLSAAALTPSYHIAAHVLACRLSRPLGLGPGASSTDVLRFVFDLDIMHFVCFSADANVSCCCTCTCRLSPPLGLGPGASSTHALRFVFDLDTMHFVCCCPDTIVSCCCTCPVCRLSPPPDLGPGASSTHHCNALSPTACLTLLHIHLPA
jgi:hypothetical protein